MAHIPDEELAVYAYHPESLAPARRSEIEREIGACTYCRTTLDFLSAQEADLTDPGVWEPLTGSATLDSLRTHGAALAAEDEEAEALLAQYLAAPARTAWKTLAAKRRYRTGGVVRRLIGHAQDLCRKEPLDALTFADAAVSIAESLPENAYTARAVYELRGSAWRARANALNFLGRFDEALEDCKRAERAYRELRSPGLGLATVAYLRGCIYFEQQRYTEALLSAETAERGFSHLGQDERQMWAVNLRANIAFEQRRLDTALVLFRQVYDYGEGLRDAGWIARGSHALGSCHLERGDLSEASLQFHTALKLFRQIGEQTEVARAEWGIALLFVRSGKINDGIRRLRGVIVAFARAGMVTDAGLAGLDLAEALLAIDEAREIVALAKHLFEVFTSHGMLTGALAAIAFLQQAAEGGTLTKTDIETMRPFLRRAERQPQLLFVPPHT
jgi:tetratricopeptide (TPR) repeat protein